MMPEATMLKNLRTVTKREAITVEAVSAVASRRYGLRVSATRLSGERDENFHLTDVDGVGYVFKLANPVEDSAVTDLQVRVLLHVERRDPDLPVPRIVPTLDGETQVKMQRPRGRAARGRLLTYVQGIPLRQTRRTRVQRANCGSAFARLGLALRDFTHPASERDLIWDLKHAGEVRPLTNCLKDPLARRVVDDVLSEFAGIASELKHLRHQIVHNDLNANNVLMGWCAQQHVVGIIDFGDVLRTALINDVAVAGVAQLAEDLPLPEALSIFVAAYHRVRPLEVTELEILPRLMAVRLAMVMTIPAWHRQANPANPHYPPPSPDDIMRHIDWIGGLRDRSVVGILCNACNEAVGGHA